MQSSDDLFVGELVLGVPAIGSEVGGPKMPGDADSDNQGDLCS